MRIKKVSGKKGSGIKKLFGSRSRKKGKSSELLFKNFCLSQGAFAVRIHDAVKGPSFAGPSQIGDFLVFKDRKVRVVDVKTERNVSRSRLKQITMWEDVWTESKFDKFYFVFVWPNGLHYLPFKRIMFGKESAVKGRSMRDCLHKLDSIDRLFK